MIIFCLLCQAKTIKNSKIDCWLSISTRRIYACYISVMHFITRTPHGRCLHTFNENLMFCYVFATLRFLVKQFSHAMLKWNRIQTMSHRDTRDRKVNENEERNTMTQLTRSSRRASFETRFQTERETERPQANKCQSATTIVSWERNSTTKVYTERFTGF